ncbi:hypothetical protein F4861DRAFT_538769 [Xylaria intraflava]|nr:hypothetical protein F4861DRAFT_538769 [Xylaria intraflava]
MALFKFSYILGILISYSAALRVTPSSPCASFCVDAPDNDGSDSDPSATANEDITCYDSKSISSLTGRKFQRCINCLQDSTFSRGSESDQLWFLYNLRYAFDNCIFGFPNATSISSTPCSTSTACGVLEAALTKDNTNPNYPDYSYCDADGGAVTRSSITKCESCIQASENQRFLVNYLVALQAGCKQRPSPGAVISLNGTVFSTTRIKATRKTPQNAQPGLSTTELAGITVAGLVVILAIVGVSIVCSRKRRNRRIRLGDGGFTGASLRRNRRPASPLSFSCQTRLSAWSPTFVPKQSDWAIEEKDYPNPHLTPGSHIITPKPPLSTTSPTPRQYQSINTSFARPGFAPGPLPALSTGAPTVPDSVHYPSSPKSSQLYPHDVTPISATSTKFTAHHSPLRSYYPAEYGVCSPHFGNSTNESPIFDSTASPFLK